MTIVTGLSGNEIYCLSRKGLKPGEICIGNSVWSLGVLGQLGAGFRTMLGGEVPQVTQIIHDGRLRSFERMVADAQQHGAEGITGVSNELVMHPNNVEFLSIGSCVLSDAAPSPQLLYTASADAQELYCDLDAGFQPVKFVFGNVAYSIGVGGGFIANLRSIRRGEVTEYTKMFNDTRHLALQRIKDDARKAGANAVLGIRTSIFPFQRLQEMVMIGTACKHEGLPPYTFQEPITSDLTPQELWNLASMGIVPLSLVLSVSVYSLGMVGSITAAFKAMARGEINELTTLIYEAREKVVARIAEEAQRLGADDVAGIKVYVYQLQNGVIEFMALGTAVKRVEGIKTFSQTLPVQAIMDDKVTFSNLAEAEMGGNLNRRSINSKKDDGVKLNNWWDVVKLLLRLFAG
ncbi:MAG: heavy metal-binding domain-containing protein [Candidatus Xenobia bacterium]